MAMTKLYTADDLLTMEGDAFGYELIRGELREVSPAGAGPSMIAGRMYVHVFAFVAPRNLGYLTGADGGFILARDPLTIVAPDVGFIRRDRVPADFGFDHFFPVPPDLAVEVLSPSNRPRQVAEKIEVYLEAGVRLLWVVDPRRRTVTIHRPDREPRVVDVNSELDGEDVLPGFRLAVAELFRIA